MKEHFISQNSKTQIWRERGRGKKKKITNQDSKLPGQEISAALRLVLWGIRYDECFCFAVYTQVTLSEATDEGNRWGSISCVLCLLFTIKYGKTWGHWRH